MASPVAHARSTVVPAPRRRAARRAPGPPGQGHTCRLCSRSLHWPRSGPPRQHAGDIGPAQPGGDHPSAIKGARDAVRASSHVRQPCALEQRPEFQARSPPRADPPRGRYTGPARFRFHRGEDACVADRHDDGAIGHEGNPTSPIRRHRRILLVNAARSASSASASPPVCGDRLHARGRGAGSRPSAVCRQPHDGIGYHLTRRPANGRTAVRPHPLPAASPPRMRRQSRSVVPQIASVSIARATSSSDVSCT
jgi:hypothetical protein